MKGIYLSQELKKELEAKIASNSKPIAHHDGIYVSEVQQARAELLEEILSEAVVLPEEESWEITKRTQLYDLPYFLKRTYPNGLIIKSK